MARTAQDALAVVGLGDFIASLKAAQVQTPTRVTRVALNKAAALVVDDARGRAPARSGKLRASIRATSSGKLARVSEGGARVPYAGFIDYVGTVGRRRNTVEHQRARAAGTARHGAVRTFIPTGRILYPAFEAQRAHVLEAMKTSLAEAMDSVGLKTDG